VAAQAVAAGPFIMLFPLVTFFLTLLLCIWWVLVAAFLYSTGDIVQSCVGDICKWSVEWETDYIYMGLYHVFGLLWTNQFIAGYGLCVIAFCISKFYWSGGDKSKLPSSPVSSAMYTVLRYHTGSIALGAFIVAVVQFVRLVLEYIDKKTKNLQEGNPILKFAMCCVKYCLWYLEKILKFINRNAYIMVAVKGSNYCASALEAVSMIIKWCMTMATVNVIGDFLLFIGKMVVAGLCGIIAFFMCDLPMYTETDSSTYLTSPLFPVLLSSFIGYMEADVFLNVYEMAIDTVLLSYAVDCDQNGGKPAFAPPLLMQNMGSNKVAPGE